MTRERSKAEASYVVGLNVADRLGFERGARGEPYEPCPYSREDFAHCFFEGWQRGCRWRASKTSVPSKDFERLRGKKNKKRWGRAVRGGFGGL